MSFDYTVSLMLSSLTRIYDLPISFGVLYLTCLVWISCSVLHFIRKQMGSQSR